MRSERLAGQLEQKSKAGRVLSARKKSNNVQFRTRDGVLLLISVGLFVALVFVFVYFVWYLPMEKATR